MRTIEELSGGGNPVQAVLRNDDLLDQVDKYGIVGLKTAGASCGDFRVATEMCPGMLLSALQSSRVVVVLNPHETVRTQKTLSPATRIRLASSAAADMGDNNDQGLQPCSFFAWKAVGPSDDFDSGPLPPLASSSPSLRFPSNPDTIAGGHSGRKMNDDDLEEDDDVDEDAEAHSGGKRSRKTANNKASKKRARKARPAGRFFASDLAHLLVAFAAGNVHLKNASLDRVEQLFFDDGVAFESLYARDIRAPPLPRHDHSPVPFWSPSSWATPQLLKVLQAYQKYGQEGSYPNEGVYTPWFYIYTPLSFFCLHIEDLMLGSSNFVSPGSAPVVWYVVPAEDFGAFVKLFVGMMRGEEPQQQQQQEEEHHQGKCRKDSNKNPAGKPNRSHSSPEWDPRFIESRRYLVHPMTLLKAGIRVTRHVQQPGEWVVIAPGAIHFGINLGLGTKAAVNWMPENLSRWLQVARQIHEAYDAVDITEASGQRDLRSGFEWIAKWREGEEGE